ncbi:SRPBCC family protein [Streptomyces sp. NPDC004111]|uniref:SRPBCC family protein n=1 Tax=Streptomyces sp. NPDC004111 TaxID=3364690 RepID=UPI0036C3A6AB
MINVERRFVVDRPMRETVDYLADFAHAVDWDPGTRSCTRIGDGPLTEGARWHNTSEFRGRTTQLVYRLARLTEDRLVFRGTNKTADSTDDLTFRPLGSDGAATEVTYRATIRFKGFAALATPFLRGEFERLGDDIVTRLPHAVEAAVPRA